MVVCNPYSQVTHVTLQHVEDFIARVEDQVRCRGDMVRKGHQLEAPVLITLVTCLPMGVGCGEQWQCRRG